MFVEPIVYHCDDLGYANVIDHCNAERINEEDMSPSIGRIAYALGCDHSEDFVQVIRYEHTVGPLRKLGYVIAPSMLLNWTILYRAVRCAESLLSGAAGVSVNVDVAPSLNDIPPLYRAIMEFLPDFVELFIKYGVQLDVPCNSAYSPYHLLLPMDVVFEILREKIVWMPTQSVYDLIFTIGCSAQLRNALLTISHILRALPVKQTQNAICHYARGGNVLELTVLLYVDATFELGIFEGLKDEYFALRKSVATSILASLEEGPCSVVGSSGDSSSKVGKHVMKSVLLILEIFYRANFSMLGSESLRVALEKRISDAGFDLTSLQNMNDVHENDVKATEVVKVVNPMVEHPPKPAFDTGMLGFESLRAATLEKRINDAGLDLTSLQNMNYVHENYVKASEAINVIKPMVGHPPKRAFHTGAMRLGPTSRETGQFRTIFTRKLYTPVVARSPATKATCEGMPSLICNLKRTWPVLASAFRRIVHL